MARKKLRYSRSQLIIAAVIGSVLLIGLAFAVSESQKQQTTASKAYEAPTAESQSGQELVTNGSFETPNPLNDKVPNGWTWNHNDFKTNEGRTCTVAYSGSCSFTIKSPTGTGEDGSRLYQEINVSGKAGETYIFSGAAKLTKIPNQKVTATVRFIGEEDSGGQIERFELEFQGNSPDYMFSRLKISPTENFEYIIVGINYKQDKGNVNFDAISLKKRL